MKKSKGFTLVELLGVIVVLALIIAIAVPSVITITNKIKNKMYCTKIENIEAAAKLYAEDEEPINTIEVSVATLIEQGYFKKESNDCSLSDPNKPCVKSPIDNKNMDNDKINITRSNNKYSATYKLENEYKTLCGR